MHAIVVQHYWAGGYYPIGGPSEITLQLIKSLEANGGRILTQAPVSSIMADDEGKAIGKLKGMNAAWI